MTLLGFLCLEAMPQCTITGAEDFGITDGILVLNILLLDAYLMRGSGRY